MKATWQKFADKKAIHSEQEPHVSGPHNSRNQIPLDPPRATVTKIRCTLSQKRNLDVTVHAVITRVILSYPHKSILAGFIEACKQR